jgi:peptidyl-prolyl cis-trans isomerase SurA
MKQIFLPFLFALALLAMPSAHAQLLPSAQGAQGNQPQMIDRIVAVVEDDVILQSELNAAVASVQHQYAANPQQLPPHDVLERQVLDRLILMKLQEQRASDQGIRVSEGEVDNAVANVAQQNKMTPDQLRAAIEQQGSSYADFRQQIADQILVQKLRQAVVHDAVQITDAEVNNLLNSATFKAGEVHLAHIQIGLPDGASAQDIAAAQAKADKAEQDIKAGMDFNAAAIRYSDASDALEGGDLGWRHIDEIPPAFADIVARMKPGDVTPPMRGPTGFHILKLVGQRAPGKQVVTEFHARQILIKPSELVTPAQAEQKARDLYQQLTAKHADFAKLAKEDSDDDTTANAGGDMGWFQEGAWGQLITQELDKLKDGEVSPPFKSEMGWHLIQRLGTRQADRTDEMRRNQAREAIGNRKAEQAYEDYLRQLRSSSYVDIRVPELRDPTRAAAGSSSSGS